MSQQNQYTATFLLHPDNLAFPSPDLALSEPDGLLAIGGDLCPQRLITAYRFGIFPWYSEHQPILWWSPNPRSVLFPEQLVISRSLHKRLRKQEYSVTLDHAFADVIRACAEPRPTQPGTWITEEMQQAYIHLHELGYAHSVEAWHDGKLVGGLYGLSLGKVFFGESMFSRRTDASKVAFVYLVQQLRDWGYALIDCQVHTEHLASLGAQDIARVDFLALLDQHCHQLTPDGRWQFKTNPLESADI